MVVGRKLLFACWCSGCGSNGADALASSESSLRAMHAHVNVSCVRPELNALDFFVLSVSHDASIVLV
jgi:hypothetical protein